MEKENAAQAAALQEENARAEAGGATAGGGFGKFKSADALLNAYNSLEAEFTRRSQRLRELEERERASAEQTARAKKTEEDEGAFERRVRSIAEACFAERSVPYVMAEGGSFCAAPPVRARSLEEAGRLAADLFRKQG